MPASVFPENPSFLQFSRFFTAIFMSTLLLFATHASAQRQVLARTVPDAAANSRPVGHLQPKAQLSLAIGLPLRRQGELDALLQQIADPSSPNFQRYLTPEQFAAEFGPTRQDYQALIDFAQSHNLAITGTHPNRTLLDVVGATEDVENAFHVKMLTYRHPVRGDFYAPDREPSADLELNILSVSGLDNYELPHPMAIKTRPMSAAKPYVTGSGPGGYFIGKDFRAAYAPGVALTGSGQTVGLLEFDGFYADDVRRNFAQAGLPAVPTQTVLLNGFTGAPGGSNIEVILDIMMAAYMAPGLAKVIVYEGSQPNDVLNRMATDNLAQQLSSSWGFSPINATTEQIFKQYIAQGQSILQASGDSGAYKGVIMTPSDDPNLTVVGGTSLATAGASGPWQSESTWPGSGGGISTAYPIPSYQQGLSMSANGGSVAKRNIPDVGLTADIQMFLIFNNGQTTGVGGTSAAAPLWAGFIALANQQAAAAAKPRLGFLNPMLYSIGSGPNYSADFHDITRGNNSGFSAVTAYDLATGWGSPAGQHLINDLTATAGAPSFALSAAPAALSIKPGGAGTSTLSIAPQNGFNAAVTLTVAGLPSGTTAAFTPGQTSTSSILTLSAGSAAVAGTYPLTVTGASGSLKSAAAVALSIVVPGFTLSPSSTSITFARGGSASCTISVSPQNGFTGSVSLAASGLPSGVTAVFSPATTASSSSLVFTATATTVAGTYPVVVAGTSGTLKTTATISLTVTAPNFTLAFQPVALTLPLGLTASTTVIATPQSDFKGVIALALSTLPAGVTATIGPANATTAGVVTFAASTAAVAGAYPVIVTGTSGTLKNTATLTLTVPPATSGFVNLAPSYNVNALAADGTPFTGGGLDGGLNGSSTAYSANLVGAQQTIGGTLFYFGPANALDAVSAKTVILPTGQFSGMRLLATAANGGQAAQTFKVTYTDGTVSTFTQSVSDWFSPQNYAGETKAMTMAYRDNGAGQKDNRTFYLYGYSLALNPSKTVSTIALPNNRNVVVLAATMTTGTAAVR